MANQTIFDGTTFHVGDRVGVHYKLIEKEKVTGKAKREVTEQTRERVQVFEGIVIRIRGSGSGKSFTVRRIGAGAIGIERIFPLSSPWIKKITVEEQGKVRRAKLYYLRQTLGREVETKEAVSKVTKPAAKPKATSSAEKKATPVALKQRKKISGKKSAANEKKK